MRVVQHALSGVVGVVGVVVVEGDEGGGVIEWVIVGGWFVFARSRKVRFPRGFFGAMARRRFRGQREN